MAFDSRTIKYVKLRASISLLALSAVGTAVAQTTAPAAPVHAHHAATASSTLPKNIPPTHGVIKTAYSLRFVDTKTGTGELATTPKFYTVNYTGWLAADGKKFDASADHGGPATFPVGAHRIIPGWDTGFAGMRVGGKRRLFIPWQLAYGETGHPPAIPAKADLIFDVELVSISDKPPTPPRPPAAPAGQPGAGSAPGAATPPPASGTTPPSGSTPPAGTPPPTSTQPSATPPPATPQK